MYTLIKKFNRTSLNYKNIASQNKQIVCFGDSLTQGYLVAHGESYPARLSQRLGCDVINSGRSGDTAEDALMRIEPDALAHAPLLTIVEFGANDSMMGVAPIEFEGQLEQIVSALQLCGSITVIAALPKTSILPIDYGASYEAVARRTSSLLIPNFMKGILENKSLMIDIIHPNAYGYEKIADLVFKFINPLLMENKIIRQAS